MCLLMYMCIDKDSPPAREAWRLRETCTYGAPSRHAPYRPVSGAAPCPAAGAVTTFLTGVVSSLFPTTMVRRARLQRPIAAVSLAVGWFDPSACRNNASDLIVL